jgi:hypothetical protein
MAAINLMSTGTSIFVRFHIFLFFQNAQQLCLQHQWHIADFIQKEGSAFAHFQIAFFILQGSGKSTAGISKKLAFQERFRKGSAINGTETFVFTRTGVMDQAGDDLLAVPLSPLISKGVSAKVARRRVSSSSFLLAWAVANEVFFSAVQDSLLISDLSLSSWDIGVEVR